MMPGRCPGGDTQRLARSPQEHGHLTSCALCLLLARLSRGLPALPSFCPYTPTSLRGCGGGPWTRCSLKAQARPGHTRSRSQKHLCSDQEPPP